MKTLVINFTLLTFWNVELDTSDSISIGHGSELYENIVLNIKGKTGYPSIITFNETQVWISFESTIYGRGKGFLIGIDGVEFYGKYSNRKCFSDINCSPE